MATLETQYNNWLKGKIKPITYSEWLEKFSEIHNFDKVINEVINEDALGCSYPNCICQGDEITYCNNRIT